MRSRDVRFTDERCSLRERYIISKGDVVRQVGLTFPFGEGGLRSKTDEVEICYYDKN